MLNGILWVLRSGAPWWDLPERYGPYTTCYNRFNLAIGNFTDCAQSAWRRRRRELDSRSKIPPTSSCFGP